MFEIKIYVEFLHTQYVIVFFRLSIENLSSTLLFYPYVCSAYVRR